MIRSKESCERNKLYARERYRNNPEVRERVKKRQQDNKMSIKEYNKQYKLTRLDKDKEYKLKSGLKIYNMTVEEYNNKLTEQNGVCALCGKANRHGYRLAVDHDHETNANRDLLCSPCNVRLGYIEDSEWLVKAQTYINKHKLLRDFLPC